MSRYLHSFYFLRKQEKLQEFPVRFAVFVANIQDKQRDILAHSFGL
jgi:hypothetical protein